MGKHGARELNYSSDIDLIVFYDVEQARLADEIEPSTFYVRLTKGLSKSSRTGRRMAMWPAWIAPAPDPGSSATAISVPTAYNYYESVGQNGSARHSSRRVPSRAIFRWESSSSRD